MKTGNRSKTIITYIALFAVSALFMLAFSLWMSPLYRHWYGCDASFFTLVGRGITDGMVPYRDFYDLKGPYFFFIQALGQLICRGRFGLFILEVIALFLSLVLIYRIGRLYISHCKTLAVIVFFLWPYISMLWGGNCLEEFCLPLNLLVIYLALCCFTEAGNNDTGALLPYRFTHDPDIAAFITGLCFTLTAFSKITAGAPITGLAIGIFILLVSRKKLKPVLFYIIFFILGALVGTLPLLIYYGIHGCILKMLYCTFIFGLKRSSDLSNAFTLTSEAKLSGVIFAALFTLTHLFGNPSITGDKAAGKEQEAKSCDLGILLLPMCIITYIVLHLGDAFIYYYITGMPCLIITLILFIKIYDPLILFKNLKQSLCWILLFIFVFRYTGDSLETVNTFADRKNDTFHEQYYQDSLNMGALIPECDRNSVFSFDIDMQWYEINNIMPCNRYVVNLQYFIALEPSIETELFDFLENSPPKWVICSNTLPDYLPQMDEVVRSKYDCLYSTDVGLVYLLRE